MSQIRSNNELAQLVGKAHTTVGRWVKHPAWPFGAAPWPKSQLKSIQAWAMESLQEDRAAEAATAAGPNDGMMKAKRALVTAKAMIAQLDYKQKNAEVHNVAECEQDQIARVRFTMNVLTSHVPSSVVREIRARETRFGRPLADLEMSEVICGAIVDAIQKNLAPPQ
jgi:hypothetical protein